MPELRLSRRFAAPRERVFEAWTDPRVLTRWWAAADGWVGAEAQVDLRAGGRYRLAMREPATGDEHAVGGEYLEVRPPERLAYTWTWEGEPEIMRGSERTLVVVEFTDLGAATEVVVTQRDFAGERIRRLHEEGWSGCLAVLGRELFGEEAR